MINFIEAQRKYSNHLHKIKIKPNWTGGFFSISFHWWRCVSFLSSVQTKCEDEQYRSKMIFCVSLMSRWIKIVALYFSHWRKLHRFTFNSRRRLEHNSLWFVSEGDLFPLLYTCKVYNKTNISLKKGITDLEIEQQQYNGNRIKWITWMPSQTHTNT